MYQPATNTTGTSSLNHLATVYYERTGLHVRRKITRMAMLADPMVLPKRNGKTIQFYRYGTLSSSTTQKTEGQVGSGLQLTTSTLSATVGQYADFITVSDLLEDTALDPIVQNAVMELSYRAALVVDDVLKAEVDSASTSTSLIGSYFSVADLAQVSSRFQGSDVPPMSDGTYKCIAHPFVTYDLKNDPQAGGFVDLVKHDANTPGANRLVSIEDRGFVLQRHGVQVFESTNVTVDSSATPDTHRIYFSGMQGLAKVDLAGRGPNTVTNPAQERMPISVIREGKSKADPEGVISAAVSYNFVFVAKALTGGGTRLRHIDAESSIIST